MYNCKCNLDKCERTLLLCGYNNQLIFILMKKNCARKMPRSTEKNKIVQFICENTLDEIDYMQDFGDDDEDINETLDTLLEDVFVVLSCRRGIDRIIPKSATWRNDILTSLDDNRFLQMLRVNRQQFATLLGLIRDNEEFNKSHSCEQFPVELQLAIVLFRLGSSGESSSIRKVATIFGISDGGVISKITKRVFKAFLKLQDQFIKWPSIAEREQIVNSTYSELPFCIGYIDATELKIAEKPVQKHIAYFSRTHAYSIKAQVVCDHSLRIRSVVVGHCGSAHDAKIFRSSAIYKEKGRFFSSQQWLAGDSAYPLSETIITPYRNNSQQLDRNKRVAFNLRHSKYRVRIEHCFGSLKEKFGSLKQLRMRLHNKESKQLACEWFVVCCILHNVLLTPPNAEEYVTDQSLQQVDCTDGGYCTSSQDAELKRQAIYSLMFD